MRRPNLVVLPLVLATAAGVACGRHQTPSTSATPASASGKTAAPTGTSTSSSASKPSAATPPALKLPPDAPTDANIAAIFLAANNSDVSYARLAPSRADNDGIKQFAQRMAADHSALNKSMNDLAAQIDLTPDDNAASLDFRDESADKRDAMRDLSGFAFDTTYIANEVSYHTKLLASIDNVLIPSARNPDLKGLLVRVRPAVAGHLAHAQSVRATLLGAK